MEQVLNNTEETLFQQNTIRSRDKETNNTFKANKKNESSNNKDTKSNGNFGTTLKSKDNKNSVNKNDFNNSKNKTSYFNNNNNSNNSRNKSFSPVANKPSEEHLANKQENRHLSPNEDELLLTKSFRKPKSPNHGLSKIGISIPNSQEKYPKRGNKINSKECAFENPLNIKSYLPEELVEEALLNIEKIRNEYNKKKNITDISLHYYSKVLENSQENQSIQFANTSGKVGVKEAFSEEEFLNEDNEKDAKESSASFFKKKAGYEDGDVTVKNDFENKNISSKNQIKDSPFTYINAGISTSKLESNSSNNNAFEYNSNIITSSKQPFYNTNQSKGRINITTNDVNVNTNYLDNKQENGFFNNENSSNNNNKFGINNSSIVNHDMLYNNNSKQNIFVDNNNINNSSYFNQMNITNNKNNSNLINQQLTIPSNYARFNNLPLEGNPLDDEGNQIYYSGNHNNQNTNNNFNSKYNYNTNSGFPSFQSSNNYISNNNQLLIPNQIQNQNNSNQQQFGAQMLFSNSGLKALPSQQTLQQSLINAYSPQNIRNFNSFKISGFSSLSMDSSQNQRENDSIQNLKQNSNHQQQQSETNPHHIKAFQHKSTNLSGLSQVNNNLNQDENNSNLIGSGVIPNLKHYKNSQALSSTRKDAKLDLVLRILDLSQLIYYFEIKCINFKDLLLLDKNDLVELELDLVARNRIKNFTDSFNKHCKIHSIEEIIKFFFRFKAFIFNVGYLNDYLLSNEIKNLGGSYSNNNSESRNIVNASLQENHSTGNLNLNVSNNKYKYLNINTLFYYDKLHYLTKSNINDQNEKYNENHINNINNVIINDDINNNPNNIIFSNNNNDYHEDLLNEKNKKDIPFDINIKPSKDSPSSKNTGMEAENNSESKRDSKHFGKGKKNSNENNNYNNISKKINNNNTSKISLKTKEINSKQQQNKPNDKLMRTTWKNSEYLYVSDNNYNMSDNNNNIQNSKTIKSKNDSINNNISNNNNNNYNNNNNNNKLNKNNTESASASLNITADWKKDDDNNRKSKSKASLNIENSNAAINKNTKTQHLSFKNENEIDREERDQVYNQLLRETENISIIKKLPRELSSNENNFLVVNNQKKNKQAFSINNSNKQIRSSETKPYNSGQPPNEYFSTEIEINMYLKDYDEFMTKEKNLLRKIDRIINSNHHNCRELINPGDHQFHIGIGNINTISCPQQSTTITRNEKERFPHSNSTTHNIIKNMNNMNNMNNICIQDNQPLSNYNNIALNYYASNSDCNNTSSSKEYGKGDYKTLDSNLNTYSYNNKNNTLSSNSKFNKYNFKETTNTIKNNNNNNNNNNNSLGYHSTAKEEQEIGRCSSYHTISNTSNIENKFSQASLCLNNKGKASIQISKNTNFDVEKGICSK